VLKVLVVDDHETIRRYITAWIAKTQIAEVIEVCANAHHGLLTCLELQPDLVLCDVHMPYVDGHGFIQQLKEAGLNTPVLLFSAHAIAEDPKSEVLAKTATVAELHNAILRTTGQLV
jgi:CheY-like chemotaxis protein